MSVHPTELQVLVAPSAASGILHTPDLKTSVNPLSHPLDPLSPDEVTLCLGCAPPVLIRAWLGFRLSLCPSPSVITLPLTPPSKPFDLSRIISFRHRSVPSSRILVSRLKLAK